MSDRRDIARKRSQLDQSMAAIVEVIGNAKEGCPVAQMMFDTMLEIEDPNLERMEKNFVASCVQNLLFSGFMMRAAWAAILEAQIRYLETDE